MDSTAGKVLHAWGGAALWILGHGPLPLQHHQDGSITFPDHNDQVSKCYDFYIRYLARAREQAEQQVEAQEYRRGYLEGWRDAMETMATYMFEKKLSLEEAYKACFDHWENELRPWAEGEENTQPEAE